MMVRRLILLRGELILSVKSIVLVFEWMRKLFEFGYERKRPYFSQEFALVNSFGIGNDTPYIQRA